MIYLTYIKTYCERGYDIDDISIKCREREYVKAKTLYCALSRKHTEKNLFTIGNKVNYKTHASVSHTTKKLHDKFIKDDITYKKLFDNFDISNITALKSLKVNDIDNLVTIQELQEENKILSTKNKDYENIFNNGDLMYLLSRFDKLSEENKQNFIVRTDAILNMMK